ncbi:MAG: efflux RND transporter periplasmic adaptor subunit [Chloroflexi bacterium]|nr:efflux RND transporter periplasmic adaptor subunit [Chloroflexota bacterium]
MNKKWWIVAGVVVLVAGLGFVGWQSMSNQQAMAEEPVETAVVRRGTLLVTVEGTGSLAPTAEVALAFLSGGQVAEVLVEEGQVVEAGQPLVRLETDDLALQVTRSEAALASAESQLAQLLAGPRPEEVAAQEANLAAVQGGVSAAAANRDQVAAGPSAAQIASAETQVASAEMERRSALINYDSIDEDDKDRKEQARYDLWVAEVALDAAQTQLDVLLTGANVDAVRAAQSNVGSAAAQRDAAQAQLDLLLAGATEEQIQAAEAAVDQARVALNQTQLRLEQATLTAPMAGAVTSLGLEPGEMVSPGQSVIVLSDLAVLEVEVNLDETDVVRVTVGQDVRVSLDAFPGVEMAGEVTYIAPTANIASGVVLYPVTIRLTQAPSPNSGQDLPVRAGMTADVEITTASQEDALIVPLRAIEIEGEHAYVQRVIGDQIERVAVELGMMTETEVEINGDVVEGDTVVVVPSAQGSAGGGMLGMFGREE